MSDTEGSKASKIFGAIAVKPALGAGIGAVAARAMWGKEPIRSDKFGGYSVNPMVAGAVLGAAETYINDAIYEIIFATDVHYKLQGFVSFVATASMGGGVWCAGGYLLNSNNNMDDYAKLFGTGVVTSVATQMLFEQFWAGQDRGLDIGQLIM